MFIQWQAAYELGIPSIDGDHRMLVNKLNHFVSRSQSAAATSELHVILGELTAEIAAHFKHEEDLLERSDFPLLASHAAEHEKLIQQISHFRESYENTEFGELSSDATQFLRRWLLDHLTEHDLPCAPYLRRLV